MNGESRFTSVARKIRNDADLAKVLKFSGQGSPDNKKMLIIGLGAAAVVVLAIAVGIVVYKKKNGSQEKN